MPVSLSKLETDFFGDIAQSPHDLWELYQFVRLHHPDLQGDQVIHQGRELLAVWVERGWLKAIPNSNPTAKVLTGDDIMKFVDQMGPDAANPERPSIQLALTERALVDINWPTEN